MRLELSVEQCLAEGCHRHAWEISLKEPRDVCLILAGYFTLSSLPQSIMGTSVSSGQEKDPLYLGTVC